MSFLLRTGLNEGDSVLDWAMDVLQNNEEKVPSLTGGTEVVSTPPDHPYRAVALAIDVFVATMDGALTEPMTKTRIGELFLVHRNQVDKVVLGNYRHRIESDGRIRMFVADMPPAYQPETRSSKK